MDKISTKLRLVRSQSMGVAMGEKVAHLRTGNASHAHNAPPSADGRSASIVLLDERRLEMTIQPRLLAGELLDLVAAHCHLKEKEYFGLAVVDESGHYTWLQLDRKVLDHELPRKPTCLTVHFLVKFFIESMSHLGDNKTIELFYLQARSLIFRGALEVESEIVFQLAALALQSAHGDFVDDANTRGLVKKSPVLPAHVLKEHSSMTYCEDQVIDHYKKTKGQTRGQAVVNYMTIVESMPTYGVHYFEVYDKRQTPWWLGLSCRGIAQYNYNDRKIPVRVFPWKQLENLYFRDKKFSIEVHDAKRVVQTLSSFNLYEDALKLDNVNSQKDELVDAIADSTTQVSVSRRTFHPGSIHVYVWFGKTQGLTKCIWQSAISQHQFYLDRKQAKMRHHGGRTLKEIARDLTRSTASLSSASSISNLSRSGSTHSLAISSNNTNSENHSESLSEQQQSEETKRARMEMVAALKARKEALESKLKEKQKTLKELCIKEAELTGELPPEIPLAPGEPLPQIRKRVGTSFALSENLLKKTHSPEEELLANLELEFEIQTKITSAALKLASDPTASKSVRKQRKSSYHQSQKKLRDIEAKLNALKYYEKKHHRPTEFSGKDDKNKEIRRGISVPDLEMRNEDSKENSIDEDQVDGDVRSCPATPRKKPAEMILHHLQRGKNPETVSLEPSSPHRMPRVTTGYIPSSVYLRSSYRSKQFPTLSTSSSSSNAPLVATTNEMFMLESSSDVSTRSTTLPMSPFRNKYEANLTQCDSPVGLYNCPQQRTSQAFSSMDDIDALLVQPQQKSRALPPKPSHLKPPLEPFPVRNLEAAANAYPSLERSIKKPKNVHHHHHHAMANRELPAIPSLSSGYHNGTSSSSIAKANELARSMEDIDSLEAAGIRGRSKMNYREVVTDEALADAMMNKLAMHQQQTHPHHLRNTEEYPAHHSPASTSGPRMLGIRPLDTGGPYPTPITSGTLLPGQTYPEPSAKPLPAMGPLQDVFYHPQRSISRVSSVITTMTATSATTVSKSSSSSSSSTSASPPPLFPKQYHQVIEHRRRSGLDLPSIPHSGGVPVPPRSIVNESPAVNRKVKPVLPTPPPLPPTPSSVVARHHQHQHQHHMNPILDESFENVPSNRVTESPSKASIVTVSASNNPTPVPTMSSNLNKFVPFHESSKPFEMSDFYKYSTKFRKTSNSSLKSVSETPSNEVLNSIDEPADSPRSSTASGSSGSGAGAEAISLPPRPKKKDSSSNLPGIGDDFSNEMLAWYQNNAQSSSKKPPQSNSTSGKPATLV